MSKVNGKTRLSFATSSFKDSRKTEAISFTFSVLSSLVALDRGFSILLNF